MSHQRITDTIEISISCKKGYISLVDQGIIKTDIRVTFLQALGLQVAPVFTDIVDKTSLLLRVNPVHLVTAKAVLYATLESRGHKPMLEFRPFECIFV